MSGVVTAVEMVPSARLNILKNFLNGETDPRLQLTFPERGLTAFVRQSDNLIVSYEGSQGVITVQAAGIQALYSADTGDYIPNGNTLSKRDLLAVDRALEAIPA